MSTVAVIVFVLLLVLASVQAIFSGQFVRVLRRRPTAAAEHTTWPKAAILLSLRGADAELAESLRRIMFQDYPDFELHIVVDSVDDPAWDVVCAVEQELCDPRLHIGLLARRRNTCGLQCGAFVQAAANISPDVETIVTVDGDLMPHPSWLRELVEPLRDERVGAAFGNRWFMPQHTTWGSLVRYAWNVAAVVPMYVFGIPWGGCFAIKRRALEESGLLDAWSRAIVHDAPAAPRLQRLGLQIRFVPSLMMVIREGCSLSFSHDFLKRQMTWTRWYHPHWSPLVLHAIITTAIWAAGFGLAAYGAVNGDLATAWYAGAGIGFYWLILLGLMALLETEVRGVVRRRGEPTSWGGMKSLLMLPATILLTQAIHLIAVLEATFLRHVRWRGVTYKLHGPLDIRLLEDRPFEQAAEFAETQMSL